jgi:hypothetical protein
MLAFLISADRFLVQAILLNQSAEEGQFVYDREKPSSSAEVRAIRKAETAEEVMVFRNANGPLRSRACDRNG